MKNIKAQIDIAIKAALKNFVKEEIEFLVEKPENESFGDYASNAAMAAFSSSKFKVQSSKFRTPFELAQKISETLNSRLSRPTSPASELAGGRATFNFLGKVEAVKPGFINFWLSKDYLVNNLREVLNKKDYGSKPQDLNKKVIVEYSSPNIAKPFTVGHLRSTIIGSAIANLLEANGWKVKRDNHLGDWGTQFGKQIYAIKTWGNEEKIEKSQNPVKELVALYVKFHEEAEKNPELEEKAREWFKKLEDGDQEARRLWKKCVDWSLKDFKIIYDKLGIKFTENNGLGFGESFFEDKIKEVLDELNNRKLLKESEGAKLVFFEKDKYPPLMIIKKDGATLYATRDLATDKFRLKEYGKDIVVINEVGIEQTLYFRQLFEVEKMLGWYKDGQRIHKRHGHYRFKDEKMSTRKGNTIWLKDVLEEAQERAWNLQKHQSSFTSDGKQVITKALKIGMAAQKNILGGGQRLNVAEAVGTGALKWNDLKRTSEQDIVFDWNEILNMQGDSGPYLQYTFARTQSVLTKSRIQNSEFRISFARSDLAKLEAEEVSLLRALNRFGEVVGEAGSKFAPNILCNYLFDLAQKFNLFYQKHKILESKQKDFRLALTQGVGQVIKNGLSLLGINAPEKM